MARGGSCGVSSFFCFLLFILTSCAVHGHGPDRSFLPIVRCFQADMNHADPCTAVQGLFFLLFCVSLLSIEFEFGEDQLCSAELLQKTLSLAVVIICSDLQC